MISGSRNFDVMVERGEVGKKKELSNGTISLRKVCCLNCHCSDVRKFEVSVFLVKS